MAARLVIHYRDGVLFVEYPDPFESPLNIDDVASKIDEIFPAVNTSGVSSAINDAASEALPSIAT